MEKEYKYLHEKVYHDIKDKILNNHFEVGDLLPKEMEMMKQYNVSRQTIRKALEELKKEDFVISVKGQGTYVNNLRANYQLSQIQSFTEIVSDQKGEPNSIILVKEELVPNEFILKKLGLRKNEKCYYIARVRRNAEDILCYEKTYINANLCPKIIDHIDSKTSLFDLYENMYGLNVDEGLYQLEATNAEPKLAYTLGIKENQAVLRMRACITLKSKKPLYYVDAYYIGSKYVFGATLKR